MTRLLLLILAAAAAAFAATYSGVLLGLYVDYVNGTSALEYYLYNGTHYLKVVGEGLGKYLGQHVTIEAEEADGVLLAKAVTAPEPLATGINPSPIKGNLLVTAVGMKFANNNTEPLPLSYIENAVFGPYPSIKDFWETSSKRQITISKYYTYAWGTLPKGDTNYCSNGYQFYQVAQDTINHLYQRGIRLPNYGFLVIVLNKQPPCEGWVLGRGTVGYAPFSTPDGTLYLAVSQVYYTAEDFDFMPVVFIHEFGHNLGLHHTGTSRYDYDSKWDVMSGGYYRVNQPSWPGSSYYTPTDTIALNKWYLGWTGAVQIGSGRVYVLKCAALAGPGDVAVLFSADGRYALEYKCRTGYDAGLPASGLIIHAINTTAYRWFYFYEIYPNGYTRDDYIPVTQEIRQVHIPMFSTWFVFGNGTHAFIISSTSLFYLVVRGLDGRVWWRQCGGVACGVWSSVQEGATDEAPGAVVVGGRLWLVVRGLDNGLYFGYVDLGTGGFSGWQPISGGTYFRPALTTDGSRLWLVVTGFDGGVWVNKYDIATGQWGTWQPVPYGSTNAAPAAAYYAGKLYIAVRGTDGVIYYATTSDGVSFSSWYTVGGSTPSAPYLTSDGTRLYLVVRGDDNRIWVSQYSGSWSSWEAIPDGYTDEAPAAVAVGGRLYVAVKGFNSVVMWITYKDTEWSTWSPLDGGTNKPITLTQPT